MLTRRPALRRRLHAARPLLRLPAWRLCITLFAALPLERRLTRTQHPLTDGIVLRQQVLRAACLRRSTDPIIITIPCSLPPPHRLIKNASCHPCSHCMHVLMLSRFPPVRFASMLHARVLSACQGLSPPRAPSSHLLYGPCCDIARDAHARVHPTPRLNCNMRHGFITMSCATVSRHLSCVTTHCHSLWPRRLMRLLAIMLPQPDWAASKPTQRSVPCA